MSFSKQSFAAGVLALGVSLAACGEGGDQEQSNAVALELPVASGWELLSSGEGTALRFVKADGVPAIHLFCPTGSGRLIINVASFKPIGSEERLSFGGSGDVVALVADSRGDVVRGGVTGEGPVPSALGFILAGPTSVNYGAQNVGPIPRAGKPDREAFLSVCQGKQAIPASPDASVPPATDMPPAASKPPVTNAPPPSAPAVSACQMQDGKKLAATRLRAIGTEPFWGARIDGRCVTYSTPEDQTGTRVWTHFTGTADGGTWIGALDGRPFELRTRKAPGCSDGMSDNRFPIAVTLRVRGETRQGCAEPS